MGLATTTLRIGLGGMLAAHGLQKFGKLGGPGLEATAQGFEQMGFNPGKTYATAAAVTETVGGGLMATGLFTPIGAAMMTGTMGVAIGKVHGKNGLFITKGGMEYNLTIIAAAFALTEMGPGLLSLDGLLTKHRKGFAWAMLELGLGAAGAYGLSPLSNRDAAGDLAAMTEPPASETAPETEVVLGANEVGPPDVVAVEDVESIPAPVGDIPLGTV